MSLRKESSAPTAEGSDPPWGSGTSTCPSGPPAHRTNIPPGRGSGAPRVPQAQVRRESSAGRLAHPPHSMRVVEACSAAAAREAAFVKPHCRPRITEVHSVAACDAAAQSPSAALIGYDGTALLHHATYAASYTTLSATWQATPLATTGAVPTRQRLDMLNGGLQEQAKISGERSPLSATP